MWRPLRGTGAGRDLGVPVESEAGDREHAQRFWAVCVQSRTPVEVELYAVLVREVLSSVERPIRLVDGRLLPSSTRRPAPAERHAPDEQADEGQHGDGDRKNRSERTCGKRSAAGWRVPSLGRRLLIERTVCVGREVEQLCAELLSDDYFSPPCCLIRECYSAASPPSHSSTAPVAAPGRISGRRSASKPQTRGSERVVQGIA